MSYLAEMCFLFYQLCIIEWDRHLNITNWFADFYFWVVWFKVVRLVLVCTMNVDHVVHHMPGGSRVSLLMAVRIVLVCAMFSEKQVLILSHDNAPPGRQIPTRFQSGVREFQ